MERISALEYVMERSGFSPVYYGADIRLQEVTDCLGVDIRRYKCRGSLRSGYPSRGFFHGAVYLTLLSKPHKTVAFPHGAP